MIKKSQQKKLRWHAILTITETVSASWKLKSTRLRYGKGGAICTLLIWYSPKSRIKLQFRENVLAVLFYFCIFQQCSTKFTAISGTVGSGIRSEMGLLTESVFSPVKIRNETAWIWARNLMGRQSLYAQDGIHQ